MENSERFARLTEREKVCLRQWLQHKSAKEIAIDLGISHHAVEKRLKMARTKLGASSTLQASRMLDEAEGYGRTVARRPDLPSYALPIQAVFTRPLIFGAITMTIIGAIVLALVTAPTGVTVTSADTELLAHEYDQQLNTVLSQLIATAEIGPDGSVFLHAPVGDERFLKLNSGSYWQISGEGQGDFLSRSLGNRTLRVGDRKTSAEPLYYNSDQFPQEPLRVFERTVRLPGSQVEWRFAVARLRNSAR